MEIGRFVWSTAGGDSKAAAGGVGKAGTDPNSDLLGSSVDAIDDVVSTASFDGGMTGTIGAAGPDDGSGGEPKVAIEVGSEGACSPKPDRTVLRLGGGGGTHGLPLLEHL